ncbi:EcsC family protein [Desulfitobacterium hafniense]|uniref:EcsC family protein n=1 Tax=Desulfitobacterium hafniense TaxID=49338 RepID=A0A098AW78_DESHA|nr:EcsC family protein [Desulfitobacterium hafniense]CDV96412.1 EcsC family protein [Desulfitobacterium hafniense]
MSNDEKFQQKLIQKIGEGMMKGIDLATGNDVVSIKKFVDQQKRLHPELENDPGALADRLIDKRKWYASVASFCWGCGGWFTIVPNLAHIWRIHGRLMLTIAYIYGYDLDDSERREEIALCFALSGGNEALKNVLKEAGMAGAKKALLTPAMKEIIKKLPNKIITIAGQKSLLNVAKVVPVAGGVVSGVMDFFSTTGIGAAAKKFYS